jgi:DNA-binding transcriptional regulator GbsR (MarR family)
MRNDIADVLRKYEQKQKANKEATTKKQKNFYSFFFFFLNSRLRKIHSQTEQLKRVIAITRDIRSERNLKATTEKKFDVISTQRAQESALIPDVMNLLIAIS